MLSVDSRQGHTSSSRSTATDGPAQVAVARVSRSAIDWYERQLGVTAKGHWPPDDPKYAHFTLGPAQVALGQYEPAPSTGSPFNLEQLMLSARGGQHAVGNVAPLLHKDHRNRLRGVVRCRGRSRRAASASEQGL